MYFYGDACPVMLFLLQQHMKSFTVTDTLRRDGAAVEDIVEDIVDCCLQCLAYAELRLLTVHLIVGGCSAGQGAEACCVAKYPRSSHQQ